MHQLLLNASPSDTLALFGGGAAILSGLSALFFIVALFGRRPRIVSQTPSRRPGKEDESEFMWVHVCRVDFDAVHGTLLNEPEIARSYKYDQVVRVPLELIVDWVYSDGEKTVGDR